MCTVIFQEKSDSWPPLIREHAFNSLKNRFRTLFVSIYRLLAQWRDRLRKLSTEVASIPVFSSKPSNLQKIKFVQSSKNSYFECFGKVRKVHAKEKSNFYSLFWCLMGLGLLTGTSYLQACWNPSETGANSIIQPHKIPVLSKFFCKTWKKPIWRRSGSEPNPSTFRLQIKNFSLLGDT
jgi:hypothetical protein